MVILTRLLLVVVLLIGLAIGIVVLQVHLSRKENKWLGWIPSVSIFLLSILLGLSFIFMMIPSVHGGWEADGVYTDHENHEQHSHSDGYVFTVSKETQIQGGLHVITIAIMFNWPVPILLMIHFAIRGQVNKKNKSEEMDIYNL